MSLPPRLALPQSLAWRQRGAWLEERERGGGPPREGVSLVSVGFGGESTTSALTSSRPHLRPSSRSTLGASPSPHRRGPTAPLPATPTATATPEDRRCS